MCEVADWTHVTESSGVLLWAGYWTLCSVKKNGDFLDIEFLKGCDDRVEVLKTQ
jgi:hypothetical protein